MAARQGCWIVFGVALYIEEILVLPISSYLKLCQTIQRKARAQLSH